MKAGDLFQNIPAQLPQEVTTTLLSSGIVRIERIVSKGHCSPSDFWYDQSENEWVIVLKGETRLMFEGGHETHLAPGAYVNIPAHQKHRVAWTTEHEETVWLAVFY